MSRPPNILNKFRSHSYYHVLAMCDRTATAEYLVGNDSQSVWERPSSDGDMGKWTPIKVPDAGDSTEGMYSIIIHGATDADLGIESYKLMALTAANATAGDSNTSLATEGEITITEPKGVVFLDLLVSLMNEMKSDGNSCCFVIKTFFVGHSYDKDEGEQSGTISDVSPVMFLLTNVIGTYSEQGGVYTLSILAQANGAARLPQYARAADGATIHLGKAINSRATVKQALDALFEVIKQNYKTHYDCVIAMAKQKKIKNPEEQYFPVEYKIDVDEIYAKDTYLVTDSPSQYKTHAGDCMDPPSFKNKTGASIEDAIHRIMSMCPQVQRDMVEGDGGGANAIKYEYKIQSTVETEKSATGKKVYVKYAVRRFMSPRGFNVQALLKDGGDGSLTAKQLRENLIEFDYIFSGKNVDILEFNIQMNNGLAYLQTATSANSFKDQHEAIASRSRHISHHSEEAGKTGEILPVPVFFAPQLRGLTTTNTNNPGLSAQAAYNMAKHASLEMAESSMKIIGNPRLYSSISATTRPSNMGKAVKLEETGTDQPNAPRDTPTLDYGDFRYWGQMPALAVVNIYMPAHNDDVALMSGAKAGDSRFPDYAKKFWYDGYYYVYAIESLFIEGEFTQQFSMIAMPNGSLLEAGELKSDTEQVGKSIHECYTNKVDEAQQADKKEDTPPVKPEATAPFPKEADKKDVVPETKQDADSKNATVTGDPSVTSGWKKASPEVQRAITEASRQSGVDATLMSQMAQIESSYRPGAIPPPGSSTAVGLYQHVDGTWLGLVRQGKIAGIPADTPRQEALNLRTNPTYSALGGAEYIKQVSASIGSKNPGDIYLGYFAGEGGGKKIIEACNNGRGGQSLETTLGNETARRMKNANPSIRDLDTEGLRAWAASRMSSTLQKGVPVASSVAIAPPKAGTKTQPKAQTPRTPPEKNTGKTTNQVAAGVSNKDTNAKKPPCGTKEPEQNPLSALDAAPPGDATKQPPKPKT